MTAKPLTTYRCAEAVSEANRLAGWEIEYRQLRKGGYRSHFGMRELPYALLATDKFESWVEITGQPPRDLVMLAVPVGDQPAGILGRGKSLTSGRVDLIDANSECDWIVPPGTSMNQVYMPREAVCRAYRRLFKEDFPRDLNGLVASAAERKLVGPLQSLTSTGLANPGMTIKDQERLAQAILELGAKTIALRVGSMPKRESIRDARRRYIYSEARDYVDSNLEHSVSVSDICEHVGVSISTLERVFARTTGLTPLMYVQARRLNKARQLLLAQGHEVTVAEVALQCGLNHFGRFPRTYRAYFGELPSQTA